MRTNLTNLSPLPRENWAVVTFPRPNASVFGVECTFRAADGRRFRAVRGQTKGLKTVYRIQAYLSGFEHVEGVLLNEAHERAGEAYALHPWVSDDLSELVPSVGVRIGGVDRWDREHSGPVLVEKSPAHARYAVQRWIPEVGIILTWWADINHNDPVMPVWGKVVWSDRGDPAVNQRFEFFAIRSGELIAFDFARRHGFLTPWQERQNWLHVLNNQPITLSDGSGLPLSGSMLAYKSPTVDDPAGDPEDFSDMTVKGLRDLRAAMSGPIVGVCLDWDGNWLASGHVPRFDDWPPSARTACLAEVDDFLESLEQFGGWFANRPVGLGRTPGQTGGQEDFGATKGTGAVTFGDPRWIRMAQYSVQTELFRGFNHFEANGTPLDPSLHPGWTTWSGGTHYHPAVSPDRLGKVLTGLEPGTGYFGVDDEHASRNNLAAYMMLSDDPLMEDQLRHLSTTDRASYRMKFPHLGNGAARAQGRTAGVWAQFVLLTEGADRQHWLNVLGFRMNASQLNPSLNVSGPMKVLAWGDPDPRKQVFRPDGTRGPWVSFWEHGLAAVGLYNAAKANPSSADTLDVLRRVCRTLARFATFVWNGEWWTVADCLWQNGEAPPGELKPTNAALVCSRGAGDVNSWTFAGLLVALEVLRSDPETSPQSLARLRDYINEITRNREATDRMTAEWWAAVADVKFPVLG